jgi:hypothetical protein
VVTDETMGDKDPLLARLLAAATAGASPAGPANKRKPIRIVLDPDAHPVAKGNLCGQQAGFNPHAATKVAANDEQGRLALCKYILRPPLANDRLKILDDKVVRLEFKKAKRTRLHSHFHTTFLGATSSKRHSRSIRSAVGEAAHTPSSR